MKKQKNVWVNSQLNLDFKDAIVNTLFYFILVFNLHQLQLESRTNAIVHNDVYHNLNDVQHNMLILFYLFTRTIYFKHVNSSLLHIWLS